MVRSGTRRVSAYLNSRVRRPGDGGGSVTGPACQVAAAPQGSGTVTRLAVRPKKRSLLPERTVVHPPRARIVTGSLRGPRTCPADQVTAAGSDSSKSG